LCTLHVHAWQYRLLQDQRYVVRAKHAFCKAGLPHFFQFGTYSNGSLTAVPVAYRGPLSADNRALDYQALPKTFIFSVELTSDHGRNRVLVIHRFSKHFQYLNIVLNTPYGLKSRAACLLRVSAELRTCKATTPAEREWPRWRRSAFCQSRARATRHRCAV
jgi:hypothetical protein